MRQYRLLALILLFSTGSIAQETFPVNGTSDPKHITYAFINARIVVDYQTILDSASMIVRDGRIRDVGKNHRFDKDALMIRSQRQKHLSFLHRYLFGLWSGRNKKNQK